MIKIAVGGQMDKQNIAALIEKHGQGQVEVSIKSDIEAVLAVKNNQAQYYFGACATGAGGALAMAQALLGAQQCLSVSLPGKIISDQEIQKGVEEGKKAFGFVNTDAEKVVPILVDTILKTQGGN